MIPYIIIYFLLVYFEMALLSSEFEFNPMRKEVFGYYLRVFIINFKVH